MKVIDIVLATVLMVLVSALWSGVLYGAPPCQERAGSGGWWSWREIDGRRCWYQGKVVKEKSELSWHVTTLPTRPLTEHEFNYQLGVEMLKNKFRDVDETSMVTQWQ
jgi:hypothetical protein